MINYKGSSICANIFEKKKTFLAPDEFMYIPNVSIVLLFRFVDGIKMHLSSLMCCLLLRTDLVRSGFLC